MNSNGRALGDNNVLSSTLPPEAQQYAELLEFQQESQSGTKNVFIYAPERVNVQKFLAGSQNILGAFYGTAPDQYTFHNLTSLQSRRLASNATVTLDINYTVIANYDTFSDTSLGDFTCPLYFTFGTIYNDTYLDTGSFPLFSISYTPFFVASVGTFSWTKSSATYNFVNYNQNFLLNDTIVTRPQQTLFGISYPDFTANPAQLTQSQFQKYIVEGGIPLAFSYAFDATSLAAADSAFLAGNFKANISYAFNYYGLLSNF